MSRASRERRSEAPCRLRNLAPTTSATLGFGLGLTIAHRLVQADGGEIEFRARADGELEAIVRLKSTIRT